MGGFEEKIPLLISRKSLNPKYQIAVETGNMTNGGTIRASPAAQLVKRPALKSHAAAEMRNGAGSIAAPRCGDARGASGIIEPSFDCVNAESRAAR
jgi:hypothetical protein